MISGRVTGIGLTPVAPLALATTGTTAATASSTSVKVSIAGTNISSTVDGAGQFTLTGVPPGTVTLNFSGGGASATITLSGIAAGDQITIEVRLNGTSARVESEHRRHDDGDDDDDDEDDDRDDNDLNEIEGVVSALSGTCPAVTFKLGDRTVKTGSPTVFSDPCASITNNARVEVKGSLAADGTFMAVRVELDD